MRTIISVVLFTLLAAAAAAAEQCGPLRIEGITVNRSGDTVRVSFEVEAASERTSNRLFIYTPVLTDGRYRVSLSPVATGNKRAVRAVNRKRWTGHPAAAAQKSGSPLDSIVFLHPHEALQYSLEIPFQYWMHDSRLDLEMLTMGCGESSFGNRRLLGGILPAPQVEPVAVAVERPIPSTGEQMVELFSFVLPDSAFNPQEPIRFYDDERDHALTVYYRINRYDIEPDYLDNHRTLVNLLAAIRLISQSLDARVERVVVAGFASPEGPFAFNDRLAWERAVSVKEYVMKNSPLEDQSISIFNGSADWRGLRLLVEQDERLSGRREVLQVLDGLPETDRMAAIRQLHDGAVYRYMSDFIFPRLRNGAFIRVYYNNRD